MRATTIEERVTAVEAVLPHLATKADLADLEGSLSVQIAALSGRVEALQWSIMAMFAMLAVFNVASPLVAAYLSRKHA